MTSPDDVVRRRLPLAREREALADAARPIDQATRPIYAVWEITLRCDLACVHCGSRALKARPDELDREEALDLVRQMAELGVREVSLIGGEAYLRDDFLDVIQAITAHGMIASLTTGAFGITPELAQSAKAAGLRAASVSVDGLRDVHDAVRGVRGSFDRATSALTALADAGLRVTANTQVFRGNAHQLEPLFDELVQRGIRGWQVQLTVAMGRAAETPRLLLEPFQVLEVIPALARLKQKADAGKVLFWPGNNIGYFGPHERALRGSYPLGHWGTCGAGRTTLGIESNGDIKGCPSLPTAEYVGGNVRQHSLRDIWERASALRFTRERTTAELWGFCASCYYAEDCKAGCSWTSHSLFGRRGNNPYCHHRALELLGRGERERVVLVEAPPGTPFDHGRYEIVLERWPEEELEAAREFVRTGVGGLPSSPTATAPPDLATPKRSAPEGHRRP